MPLYGNIAKVKLFLYANLNYWDFLKSPRSKGQGYWYLMKALATKNTYVKCGNTCLNPSEVMVKVTNFEM